MPYSHWACSRIEFVNPETIPVKTLYSTGIGVLLVGVIGMALSSGGNRFAPHDSKQIIDATIFLMYISMWFLKIYI